MAGVKGLPKPHRTVAEARRYAGGTWQRHGRNVAGKVPEVNVQVLDPYAAPGRWVKGQAHAHTTRSDGRLPPEAVMAAYRERGFDFLCLTDHDRLHAPAAVIDGLLVPGGEESTVGPAWLPVGRHLLRLFVERDLPRRGMRLEDRLALTAADGGLAAACHPLWPGNLGTGRWQLKALLDPRLELMEIVNHHSPLEPTLWLWDEALRRRGPQHPLWGLAVDDSHRPEEIGRAWIWVKLPRGPQEAGGVWHGYPSAKAACAALREALRRGAFYATTGLQADFRVEPPGGTEPTPVVTVRCEGATTIRFVGPGGQLLAEGPGPAAKYPVRPTDGYVRVGLGGPGSARAWSQPFWVVSPPSE